jgi:hypothetical protein
MLLACLLMSLIVFKGAVSAADATAVNEAAVAGQEKAVAWFDFEKTSFALLTVAICGTVIICTELARRGKPFYVRPIAGLRAMEESVGRPKWASPCSLFLGSKTLKRLIPSRG